MVMHGASKIFKMSGALTDNDIDHILKRGEEKTNKQNEEINKALKK